MRDADRPARVVEHDRHAAVDGRRHREGVRDAHGDRRLDRRLDVVGPQAHLGVGPVEHDDPGVLGAAEHVEGVDGDPEVLHGRDVERGDEDEGIGEVARRQHVLGERRRRVDDDVVVVLPSHLEQLGGDVDRDPVGIARVVRGADHVEAAVLVHGDEASTASSSMWPLIATASKIDLRGHQLQADRDVAEREVEVDEQRLDARCSRGGRAEVRGQGRLADAALGGEDRDDLALLGRRHPSSDR